MGERHDPKQGDLPPVAKDSVTVSDDILFKTTSGDYYTGLFRHADGTFFSYNGLEWTVEEIEAWWYLPE